MTANLLIADRAFDADSRVLDPLAAAGKSAVIPPRPNRLAPRELDRELYKERHLIEPLNLPPPAGVQIPRTYLGEAAVLMVGDRWAVVRLTDSFRLIQVGDEVELK